jgi:hypothetical protein
MKSHHTQSILTDQAIIDLFEPYVNIEEAHQAEDLIPKYYRRKSYSSLQLPLDFDRTSRPERSEGT